MTTRKTPLGRRRRWSKKVTATSHAMDLEPGVFSQRDPARIAASLQHSAEHSHTRKADPFRSAMSMLTFYINRAGSKLSRRDGAKLQRAKAELRHLFGRDDAPAPRRRPAE